MQALLTQFARTAGILTRTLDRLGGWVVLPLIAAMMIWEVFMRYVINSPPIWGLEFSQWFLLLVFVAAIPECTRRHGHIRMELLYSAMPGWFKRAVTVIYAVIGIWLFWLLGAAEYDEFSYSLELGRTTEYLELPIWLQHAAMVAMCAIVILLFAARALGTLIGKDPFPEQERDPTKYEE